MCFTKFPKLGQSFYISIRNDILKCDTWQNLYLYSTCAVVSILTNKVSKLPSFNRWKGCGSYLKRLNFYKYKFEVDRQPPTRCSSKITKPCPQKIFFKYLFHLTLYLFEITTYSVTTLINNRHIYIYIIDIHIISIALRKTWIYNKVLRWVVQTIGISSHSLSLALCRKNHIEHYVRVNKHSQLICPLYSG